MIKKFNSIKKVYNYIIQLFAEKAKSILIKCSTTIKTPKNFSDFDIEIYTNKLKKPYYEIVLLNQKIILISAYFYKFKKGEKTDTPKNIKLIYGEYNKNLSPNYKKDNYNQKQKIKRECQLAIDFFFKYLRHNNLKYLESVQKRIK